MIMIMIRRIAAITFIRRCFVSSRTFFVCAAHTREFYVLNMCSTQDPLKFGESGYQNLPRTRREMCFSSSSSAVPLYAPACHSSSMQALLTRGAERRPAQASKLDGRSIASARAAAARSISSST